MDKQPSGRTRIWYELTHCENGTMSLYEIICVLCNYFLLYMRYTRFFISLPISGSFLANSLKEHIEIAGNFARGHMRFDCARE